MSMPVELCCEQVVDSGPRTDVYSVVGNACNKKDYFSRSIVFYFCNGTAIGMRGRRRPPRITARGAACNLGTRARAFSLEHMPPLDEHDESSPPARVDTRSLYTSYKKRRRPGPYFTGARAPRTR